MNDPIPAWLEREVAEYDLAITPPPATILDLGANIGAFSRHYARKWPQARITAFEPVGANLEALLVNLKPEYDAGRIGIFQAAVRAEGGAGKIFKGDNFVTHSFHQRGRQTDEKIPVVITAAHTIRSHELVKIDTEGCELEILQNLNLTATRAVVVEYHSPADRLAIMTLLDEKNFRMIEHIPGSTEHGVMKFAGDDGVTLPGKAESEKPKVEIGKARKVYLATAAHFSNFDLSYLQSLLTLVVRPSVAIDLAQPNTDPSVERARNILTANFLESDCTHILFVDADISFTPADVARISSHDEAVVGGLYPLKQLSPEVAWCGNGLEAGEFEVRPDGLSQVKYIGTGFLCVRRDVFEQMIAARGAELVYKQDFPPNRQEYAFWRQGVRCGRFLTEDWMFCQTWLELGGSIYADSQVVLRHAGRAVWPLPFQKGNPFNPKPETGDLKPETK